MTSLLDGFDDCLVVVIHAPQLDTVALRAREAPLFPGLPRQRQGIARLRCRALAEGAAGRAEANSVVRTGSGLSW